MVVGGDKLEYNYDWGAPATDLLETKILINSVILDACRGARLCSMDLKDMFLHAPMEQPEYMKVKLKYFPSDIIQQYELYKIVHNDGHVYIKIIKGMYGLKQAAILAYKILYKLLLEAGYHPIINSSGVCKRNSRRKICCLCVNDFGVKYHSQEDLDHLKMQLKISTRAR